MIERLFFCIRNNISLFFSSLLLFFQSVIFVCSLIIILSNNPHTYKKTNDITVVPQTVFMLEVSNISSFQPDMFYTIYNTILHENYLPPISSLEVNSRNINLISDNILSRIERLSVGGYTFLVGERKFDIVNVLLIVKLENYYLCGTLSVNFDYSDKFFGKMKVLNNINEVKMCINDYILME